MGGKEILSEPFHTDSGRRGLACEEPPQIFKIPLDSPPFFALPPGYFTREPDLSPPPLARGVGGGEDGDARKRQPIRHCAADSGVKLL